MERLPKGHHELTHVERTHPFLEWEGNKGQPWMLLLLEKSESPLKVA
jgi:hypothetical protein